MATPHGATPRPVRDGAGPVLRWYCVVMGAVVQPVAIAAGGGRPGLVPFVALVTVGPWLVAAFVARPWTHVAATVLSVFVLANVMLLSPADGANRAIGWASVTLSTYYVAALAIVAHGITVWARRRR